MLSRLTTLFLDEIGELGGDEQAMILRALEDKTFLPVGADREASSDFQLIAGTNRDLGKAISEDHLREDLYARLNLWTFELSSLKDRREDIELQRFAEREGVNITFNLEAQRRYLCFASAPEAEWSANFRDLGASITPMATLAAAGRINEAAVTEEIERLNRRWRARGSSNSDDLLTELLGQDQIDALDLFDRVRLREIVAICRSCSKLSEAGRRLFAPSRNRKAEPYDADRLKKYLSLFGLDWQSVRGS